MDSLIAPGGTFIGTTLDKKNVIELFNEEKSDKVERSKDGVLMWKIEG